MQKLSVVQLWPTQFHTHDITPIQHATYQLHTFGGDYDSTPVLATLYLVSPHHIVMGGGYWFASRSRFPAAVLFLPDCMGCVTGLLQDGYQAIFAARAYETVQSCGSIFAGYYIFNMRVDG